MANYKNLLDILKRNGCKAIILHDKDIASFVKYVQKNKYTDKLNFTLEKGQYIITRKKEENG